MYSDEKYNKKYYREICINYWRSIFIKNCYELFSNLKIKYFWSQLQLDYIFSNRVLIEEFFMITEFQVFYSKLKILFVFSFFWFSIQWFQTFFNTWKRLNFSIQLRNFVHPFKLKILLFGPHPLLNLQFNFNSIIILRVKGSNVITTFDLWYTN